MLCSSRCLANARKHVVYGPFIQTLYHRSLGNWYRSTPMNMCATSSSATSRSPFFIASLSPNDKSELLLLEDHRWPADFLRFDIVQDFNAVGYCNKGNFLCYPVILAIEVHYPFDLARSCALAAKN